MKCEYWINGSCSLASNPDYLKLVNLKEQSLLPNCNGWGERLKHGQFAPYCGHRETAKLTSISATATPTPI